MKFIKGQLGVREPQVQMPVPVWDVDAFIIPGLAFDTYGARLGFGAGYYDRILSAARKSAKLIGVCYDWQVIEGDEIPQESHDIRVGWIVTEKRVIKCGKKTGESAKRSQSSLAPDYSAKESEADRID
jgi:5-formyltetrahydrofolate cyclo-ligase